MSIGLRLLLAACGGGAAFTPPATIPDQGQGLPGVFTRYAGNPVVALGGVGDWDEDEIDGEQVFYDHRLGKYVMVFGAYAGAVQYNIGLAYSDDLLTWTKEPTNPVFSAVALEGSIVAPNIVQLSSNSYRMYYQSYGGTDGSSRIYMATSTDLLTWTRANSGVAIIAPVAGTWYESAAFDPNAWRLADGTTKLFYGGQDSFASRGIGYAILASDGITILSTTLPLPLFYDGPGEIMDNIGAGAFLASAEARYAIFHDASASPGDRYINREWTTDGSTFTLEQTVLGPGSGWDVGQVFDAAPVWKNGVLYLFYAGSAISGGSTGLAAQIGLATMPWP